jgi:hypothetical protein
MLSEMLSGRTLAGAPNGEPRLRKMQTRDAEALRKAWGDKPCAHPQLVKEYYLGTHTLEYVCTQCGRAFSDSERREIESRLPPA